MNFVWNARLPRSIQGSFTCRKPTTWDRRLYFPSEGRRAEDFFALKNPRTWVPKASTLPLDHRSHYGNSFRNIGEKAPTNTSGDYFLNWSTCLQQQEDTTGPNLWSCAKACEANVNSTARYLIRTSNAGTHCTLWSVSHHLEKLLKTGPEIKKLRCFITIKRPVHPWMPFHYSCNCPHMYLTDILNCEHSNGNNITQHRCQVHTNPTSFVEGTGFRSQIDRLFW